MDKLKEVAESYRSYMDYMYKIKLGKKSKIKEFEIHFRIDEFHHLIGLHKLKGHDRIKKAKRETIFSEILNGAITYDSIRNLKGIDQVNERIELVNILMPLIDSNDVVKVWHKKYCKGSNIVADYIFRNITPAGESFMFSRCCHNEGEQNFTSIFKKSDRDYSFGQEYWTLLYKEKINLLTKTSTVLLNKMNP